MKHNLLLSFIMAALALPSFAQEKKTLAYVVDTEYSSNYVFDNDPVYKALEEAYSLDLINVNASSDVALIESLANYDIIFSAEAVASVHDLGKELVNHIGETPMVNMKTFYYKSGVWNIGSGVNVTKGEGNYMIVDAEYRNSDLFADVNVDPETGACELFNQPNSAKNQIQGFTITNSTYANDKLIATVGSTDTKCMQIHEGNKAMFITLGISYDDLDNLSQNAIHLIRNCVEYVLNNKVGANINETQASIEIASETYYSITGSILSKPTTGVNIRKIVYKDGTSKAVKIIVR